MGISSIMNRNRLFSELKIWKHRKTRLHPILSKYYIIAIRGLQIVLFNTILWTFLTQPAVASTRSISLEKITVGQDSIEIGSDQLIEVVIKNKSRQEKPVLVKLRITLPNHNIITFGKKHIVLRGESISRVLIPYPIHKLKAGDYSINARVFSMSNRLLAKNTSKQEQFFFAYDPKKPKSAIVRRRNKEIKLSPDLSKEKELPKSVIAPVKFDPPDLMWDEVKFINKLSVLRGDSANVQLTLLNDGGDVATNIGYNVYWYFIHRNKRLVNFFHGDIKVIAPGERKIIELPVTIPETEQKGTYQIKAVVDENNRIVELNDNNNSSHSKIGINFSDIALVFPEDGYSFAEDGLFKFSWKSKKYNQYKVQISADPAFYNLDETFEIPKGSEEAGWSFEQEIIPLVGEMPHAALAIMKSNNTDHLYWRILAQNSEGKTAESEVRKFFINLKAAP